MIRYFCGGTGAEIIMTKRTSLVLIIIAMFGIGCAVVSKTEDNSANHETVTANVMFRAFSAIDKKPLSDVNIVVIDQDDEVNERLVTNDRGEVNKYRMNDEQGIEPRGAVTVIASREGYRDAVILETPVSKGSAAQPFYLESILPDERDEPTIQLGNNHRLEIISLVNKYVDGTMH